MGALARILFAMPKHGALPVICAVTAWYAGAKYGAPDALINSIDAVLAQGGDLVGNLTGGATGAGE